MFIVASSLQPFFSNVSNHATCGPQNGGVAGAADLEMKPQLTTSGFENLSAQSYHVPDSDIFNINFSRRPDESDSVINFLKILMAIKMYGEAQ